MVTRARLILSLVKSAEFLSAEDESGENSKGRGFWGAANVLHMGVAVSGAVIAVLGFAAGGIDCGADLRLLLEES